MDADPVITTCPTLSAVTLDGSCAATMPDLTGQVEAIDNSTRIASVSQTPTPGATITGQADVTVTFTAWDFASHTTTCSAVLPVVEAGAPTITACPGTAAGIPTDTCGENTVPDVTGLVTVTDACSPELLTVDQSPLPGTVITANTAVLVTATDGYGNTDTCTITVTLTDDTGPAITLNPDPFGHTEHI